MKKVIVSVINDLVTDQRVHRTCTVLHDMGFEVILIGRKKRNSLELQNRVYQTVRMKLLFERGPLFYAEFNFRLFLYLIFYKADLLYANDLDTLLPNYLNHKLKRKAIIYDSHEYFTETPELANRRCVKKIWKRIEKFILPRLTEMITVNDSLAEIFRKEYPIKVHVIRNIPLQRTIEKANPDFYDKQTEKSILIQGAGLNIDGGLEEFVEAMQWIQNAKLFIVGDGDVIPSLKSKVNKTKLQQKVIFIPKQRPEKLYNYTKNADLGISFDKDTNLNYKYSLPNKIFDYIHAGLPVMASPLVEIKKIIDRYKIGECIENHEPKHIAEKINTLLNNSEKLLQYKANCITASKELNWENEKLGLIHILEKHV